MNSRLGEQGGTESSQQSANLNFLASVLPLAIFEMKQHGEITRTMAAIWMGSTNSTAAVLWGNMMD